MEYLILIEKRTTHFLLLTLTFILVFGSCTKLRNKPQLVGENTIPVPLRFHISLLTDKEKSGYSGAKAALKFHNESDSSIVFTKPQYGCNLLPVMIDSSQDTLQVLFRLKVSCQGDSIIVSGGRSFEMEFPYTIDSCFDMRSSECYWLSFKYFGKIRFLNGKEIAYDKPLLSNVIQLCH